MQSQTPAPAPARNTFDYVYLRDLQLSAVVGQDAWGRADKPQPVLVSVKWYQAISGIDDLQQTLNYSKIAKDITESIDNRRGGFVSAQSLAEFILYVATEKKWKGLGLSIDVHLPKALLYAGNGLRLMRSYQLLDMEPGREVFSEQQLHPRTVIEDVRIPCVIGVNAHEREAKQMVRLDFEIEEDLRIGSADGIGSHWRSLVKHAFELVESSSFQTVEALGMRLATALLKKWPARTLTVSVEKPNALPFVAASGARVTRYKSLVY